MSQTMQNVNTCPSDSIFLLLDSSGPGGIETHVYQLAATMHRDGWPVAVVFLSPCPAHPLVEQLLSEGISYHMLGGGSLALARLLRKHRPALVHAHGYKANILSRLFCRLLAIPQASTFHAGEKCRGKLALYDAFDRRSAVFSSAVLTVSDEISARVSARCQQVNNFINTDTLAPSQGKQIAFVGRLSPEKGADIFCELARSLIARGCATAEDFHLYGDGPQRQALESQYGASVNFHGFKAMDEVWPHIGTLVISSRFEGLPLCSLEAMGRGIVVIAAKLGQLDSLIDDGVNGFLVPPENLAIMAQRLEEILALPPAQRERVCIAARERIEAHYSCAAVRPFYRALYAGLGSRSKSKHVQSATVPRSRKVLLVHYGEEWIRGSEQCLLQLSEALKGGVFEPVVWTNSRTLAAELAHLRVRTYVSDFSILFGWQSPRLDFLAFFSQLREARSIIRREGIELVHLNNAGPGQWMIPSARATGIPVLTQLHAPYLFRDRVSLFIEEADLLVGVSEAVLQPFQKMKNSGQARCIYNGLDAPELAPEAKDCLPSLRRQLGLDEGDLVLVSVGSLIHRKGMDKLIRALHGMHQLGVKAALVLMGDGPEKDALVALSRELGLAEHVYFMGEQAHAAARIKEADIFVSGARDEAFGLVLVEAGLAHLPCIAPRVGGIPEVIVDGESGLLYEPDQPDQLVGLLMSLHRAPQRRRALGLAGYQRCKQHFSRARNQRQLMECYQQLLSKEKPAFAYYGIALLARAMEACCYRAQRSVSMSLRGLFSGGREI